MTHGADIGTCPNTYLSVVKFWGLLSGSGNRPSHQAWQGRSLKEWMSLKATTKQWYMGSWWIKPPASPPLREDDPYTWPVWSPKFLSGIEPQLPTCLKMCPWQSSFNSQSQFSTSLPVFPVFTSQLKLLTLNFMASPQHMNSNCNPTKYCL